MKTKNIIFIMILLFALSGCDSPSSEKEKLSIDLGVTFQEDFVLIMLDNKTILSETISTNQTIGLAKGILIDYPTGNYELTITIGNVTKKDFFLHKKNRFIYIDFDKSKSEIKVQYPLEKIIYD